MKGLSSACCRLRPAELGWGWVRLQGRLRLARVLPLRLALGLAKGLAPRMTLARVRKAQRIGPWDPDDQGLGSVLGQGLSQRVALAGQAAWPPPPDWSGRAEAAGAAPG